MYRIIIFLILFSSFKSFAQNQLFVPKEIQKTYDKNIRKTNGEVGQNYWRNFSDYNIEVSLIPEKGLITGKSKIIYTNNSPQDLHRIILNLYQDLFKKGIARDRTVDVRDIHKGVAIHSLKIDEYRYESSSYKIRRQPTFLSVSLPKAIKSNGGKSTIEINWSFKMPKHTKIRMGKYDATTYFVAYWYPQIAVYDAISGWDKIGYDGLHEFYDEFANFDVKIKVPAKQIVWATGVLQNPKEVLKNKFYKRYKKSLNTNDIIHIIEQEDYKSQITVNKDTNIWHFKANNVNDFAFATSSHYLWDATSTKVDKDSKNVHINSAYDIESGDFKEVTSISKKSVMYLSNEMPAVPFPYPSLTVFRGAGGMEFPMMVNQRSSYNRASMINVTTHEIAHTYFPFYMGINQEKYSWMDEGWAMYLVADLQKRLEKNNDKAATSVSSYRYYSGTEFEAPIMQPSFNIKRYDYYIASYYKPEIAYRILADMLGDKLFKKALKEYINRWNGKHPCPYDFFYTFNDIAKEDLSWYWQAWFFDLGVPDIGVNKVEKTKKGYQIEIQKIGRLPIPLDIDIIYKDKSVEHIHKTARIWKNKTIFIYDLITDKTISKVNIGHKYWPDVNSSNNRFINEK